MYGPPSTYIHTYIQPNPRGQTHVYRRGNKVLKIRKKGKVISLEAIIIYQNHDRGMTEELECVNLSKGIFRLTKRRADSSVPITDVIKRNSQFPLKQIVNLGSKHGKPTFDSIGQTTSKSRRISSR